VSVGRVQKRLGRVGVWPENVRSWARPRRGARAIRGGTVLTGGTHGAERERASERASALSSGAHVREGNLRRQVDPTEQREGEREERAGARRR
jgi:DNA-binding transcriptional regulator YdaS (Cro superfamily)